MAKSQEAPRPQIPRNLRNYGISEPWADSAPPEMIGLKIYILLGTFKDPKIGILLLAYISTNLEVEGHKFQKQ